MVLNSWQFSAQLRTNFESTLYVLRRNFEPTSNELRLNFERTSSQLRTNFEPTSNELRLNFERTSAQLRTNFEATLFEVREVRTSHGNIISAATVSWISWKLSWALSLYRCFFAGRAGIIVFCIARTFYLIVQFAQLSLRRTLVLVFRSFMAYIQPPPSLHRQHCCAVWYTPSTTACCQGSYK